MPDLLESIMRPTDPVKEELRPILFKTNQFRPEITKIKVCTFQMSGKIPDSTNVAFEAVILTPFCNIWPRQRPNISKKQVLARRAPTLVLIQALQRLASGGGAIGCSLAAAGHFHEGIQFWCECK